MPYLVALAVIIIAGIGFTLFQSDKVSNNPQTAEIIISDDEADVIPETSSPTDSETANNYNNGVFNTVATYKTPNNDIYSMNVSLTLEDDTVTESNIVYVDKASNSPSVKRFEAAYRNEVIGKNIDTINLSRVGGASLTSNAFNQALTTIKTDAKS